MRGLCPIRVAPDAERAVQPGSGKSSLFRRLSAGGADAALLHSLDDHSSQPRRARQRTRPLHFYPVALDPRGFAPLRLAGHGALSSGDPRFGGISALAIDRGELLALTDSGVLVRLRPPSGRDGECAAIRETSRGPGDPGFKSKRDPRHWSPTRSAAAGGWRSRTGDEALALRPGPFGSSAGANVRTSIERLGGNSGLRKALRLARHLDCSRTRAIA